MSKLIKLESLKNGETLAGLCSRPNSTVQVEDERGNLRKLNSKEASICEIDKLIDKMIM